MWTIAPALTFAVAAFPGSFGLLWYLFYGPKTGVVAEEGGIVDRAPEPVE